MFLDDLVAVLVEARVGVYGRDIFISTKAIIPTGDGPYCTITETGGSAPEDTHNAANEGFAAYHRPNAQLLFRAKSYAVAWTMANAAYEALYMIQNQFINNVWYRQISILQEPHDFGLDDLNRACLLFNIACVKRANAARSV